MEVSGEFSNSLLLLGVAAFNAVTAFLAWRTHNAAKRVEKRVEKVEEQTNSMSESLVKAAEKEGFHEGVKSVEQVEVAISKVEPSARVTATHKPKP